MSVRHRPLRASLSQASITSSVLGHETRYNAFLDSAKKLKLTRRNTADDLQQSQRTSEKLEIDDSDLARVKARKIFSDKDANDGFSKGNAMGKRVASLFFNVDLPFKSKGTETSTKL